MDEALRWEPGTAEWEGRDNLWKHLTGSSLPLETFPEQLAVSAPVQQGMLPGRTRLPLEPYNLLAVSSTIRGGPDPKQAQSHK